MRRFLAPSGACTRRAYESIRPFDCDAGTLHYELGSQDAMRSGSNLSYSSLTGAQTIHGAKWTTNWHHACHQCGLIVRPQVAKSLATSERQHGSRSRGFQCAGSYLPQAAVGPVQG